MGIKKMMARGLMFCMMSLGMPWSCIVPADINVRKVLCFINEFLSVVPTLGDEIVHHLRIGEPINWVKEEDATRRKSTPELIYVNIIP